MSMMSHVRDSVPIISWRTYTEFLKFGVSPRIEFLCLTGDMIKSWEFQLRFWGCFWPHTIVSTIINVSPKWVMVIHINKPPPIILSEIAGDLPTKMGVYEQLGLPLSASGKMQASAERINGLVDQKKDLQWWNGHQLSRTYVRRYRLSYHFLHVHTHIYTVIDYNIYMQTRH